jgi:hypothetical protein
LLGLAAVFAEFAFHLPNQTIALVLHRFGIDATLGLVQGDDADAQGGAGEAVALAAFRVGGQGGDGLGILDEKVQTQAARLRAFLPMAFRNGFDRRELQRRF